MPSGLALVLAAAVVFTAAAAFVRAGRSGRAAFERVLAGAIAIGFCVALAARHVRPSFPIGAADSGWSWAFWFAPIGALLCVAETWTREPAPSRARVTVVTIRRLAAAAVAAWLVLREIHPTWIEDAARWLRVAVAAVVTAALWSSLAAANDRGRAASVATSVVAGTASASFVLLRVGRSGVMAEAMLALAVVALASASATLAVRREFRIPAAAAATIALAVGALTVAGFPMRFDGAAPQFHVPTATLLAVAPATGWLVPARARPLVAVPVAALAAIAVVLVAGLLGGILSEGPAPDGL